MIMTAIETLQARGVTFAPVVEDKATRIATFNDPDGNPLYLVEVKPEAWNAHGRAEK
jgi:hypothetical protein